MQSTFVPYLNLNDYLPTINSEQLNNQILDAVNQGGNQQRQFAESFAIGKIRGMLSSFFDLDFEINPTLPFDYNKKYFAGNRVTIDFPDWVAGTNQQNDEQTSGQSGYVKGNCVIKDGVGYFCKEDNNDSEFKSQNWIAIGNQYDIYYIKYPYNIFSLEIKEQRGTYTEGFYYPKDVVWWENRTWECLIGTMVGDHQSIEQNERTYLIPKPNQFPNARTQQQWLDLGEFSFVNELPFYPTQDSTSVWTLGDNRDPIMVQAVIDIALWMLHRRISPNNIPKMRVDAFDKTYEWLKAVQKGEQSISCPAIQPRQVDDISWGSDIKKANKLWG